MPVASTQAAMKSSLRRLRAVAAHVAVDNNPPDEPLLVGFGGGSFQPTQPMSLDKDGGVGRQAWADMRDGGQSKVFQVAHQIFRRDAETGGSRLWRIHGKMYDLESFMDRHPGGRVWIALTQGTDATQAFEAYHLDGQRVEAVLAKYYVRDVEEGEFAHGDRFTFEEEGFFRTLRRRVLERLKSKAGPNATTREATAATFSMHAACAVVIAQFVILHSVARSGGSVLAAALAGIGLTGCWGVGHNFMHQAQDKAGWWPYAIDLTGVSNAPDWRISHCLSHHLDTNLETDWEYANFFPSYVAQSNSMGKFLVAAAPFFGLVLQMRSLAYILDTVRHCVNGVGKTVGKHFGQLMPGFLPFLQLLSYIRGRGSMKKGFLLYMVQSFAFYLAFVPLSAGVHHSAPPAHSEESDDLQEGTAPRNTHCWMEHQAGAQSDWGAHEVVATTDHTVLPRTMPAFLRDWISLTFFGYLNNHTLHHLFPGVDQCHLQDVRDVLEETAREFGLDEKDIKAYPMSSIYMGYFRYLFSREVRSKL